jgi:hypothetical protein
MKSYGMSVACLGLGFAAGWALRPTGGENEGESAGSMARRPARVISADASTVRPTRIERPAMDGDDEVPSPARAAADRERMVITCRQALEIRLAAWARELALEDATVAALREEIDRVLEAAEPPVEAVALPMLRAALEERLDAAKAGLLAEQEALRQQERTAARVDAKLAELRGLLLLAPVQQERLREHYWRDAGSLPDPLDPQSALLPPAVMAEIQAGMGEDGDFATTAAEVLRERIAAETRALEEILMPDQLETYRLHLESRFSIFLHGR